MTERVEISEAMVTAATTAGKASGALAPNARHADVRRLLAAAVAEMSTRDAVRYNLLVNTAIETKKARFVEATGQRCYYRVECEDGQQLVVHGNDIRSGGRAR
jgi:hypothetical protein